MTTLMPSLSEIMECRRERDAAYQRIDELMLGLAGLRWFCLPKVQPTSRIWRNSLMPLRDIIMPDETAIDQMAECRRELHNAYERIEELESALKGMVDFTDLLSRHRAMPEFVRETLQTNPRVIDARELLR